MKAALFLVFLFLFFGIAETIHRSEKHKTPTILAVKKELARNERKTFYAGLQKKTVIAKQFIEANKFSNNYAFFVDMRLPSGKQRFFVYDLKGDSILAAGLVTHGSCNTRYLENPEFSNEAGCGCSSIGKYKIGYAYSGQFGKAFKLHGLEASNSNAFKRNVVLHSYDEVPDKETDPLPICNSLGCPMVSPVFLSYLTGIIEKERKPVLLWIYN